MKTERISEKETKGHTYAQWISGVVANSTLLTYGLQAGWLSPAAARLQSVSSPTGSALSARALGWLASAMPAAALLAVPAYALLADRIGRRRSILLMTVPQLACWLLKLFATNLACLVMARIMFGLAAAGCFGVVPMYNKEIAQDDVRGRIGSMLVFFLNLGILSIYALGAYLDYYTLLHVVVGIPALTFLCMLMCPESPGYLVKIGRLDEAAKSLSCLRGLPVDDKAVQRELENMMKQDEYYKSLPNLSLMVILKDKAWRKAYLIASILIVVQALSGNFALVTYGAGILETAGGGGGGGGGAKLQTLSFPAVMMMGSVVSICIMERVRRRTILLVCYAGSLLSLGGLATVTLLPRGTVPAWVPLLAVTCSMFVYALGVLPGPYIVMSEMFNIQIRAKIMGVVVAQGWSMCFAQLATFAPVSAALGVHTYFYICAATNLLGIAAVLVLVPETRGKSVGEIEEELRK